MHFFYLGWVQRSNSSISGAASKRGQEGSRWVYHLHRIKKLCHKCSIYIFSLLPINKVGLVR